MEREPSQLAHPQRLSVASHIQSDCSPLTTEFNPDNPASSTPETPLKREGSIGGAWGKIVVPSQGPRPTVGAGPGLTALQLEGTGKTSIQASAERAEEALLAPKWTETRPLAWYSPLTCL